MRLSQGHAPFSAGSALIWTAPVPDTDSVLLPYSGFLTRPVTNVLIVSLPYFVPHFMVAFRSRATMIIEAQ